MARRQCHVLMVAVALLLLVSRGLSRPQEADYDEEEDEYDYDDDLTVPEDAEADKEFAPFFAGSEDEKDEEGLVGTSASAAAKDDGLPADYIAVNDGLVVFPPADRGACKANDAVFASTTAIEACLAKVTGKLVSLSAQQLLDCAVVGPKKSNTTACSRPNLSAHAYLKWATNKKIKLASATDYPYKENQTSTCPAAPGPKPAAENAGARIKETKFTTSQGSEKKLKQMVFEYGAVVTTVYAGAAYRNYKSGIFNGCKKAAGGKDPAPNHVVTVVGYGKDPGTGQQFWLLKNSRGTAWGEQGFMRMRRNVGMCGIGKALAVPECEPVVECNAGEDDCEDDDDGTNSDDYEGYDEAEDEDEEAEDEEEERKK